MDESDTKQLREINSQLLPLYLELDRVASDPTRQQILRTKIAVLESQKGTLPDTLLYDDKIQQYVTILRSAAGSLQLQRQTVHQFSQKSNAQLSPDEIRQKNIALNKIKSIEKKVESYRKRLSQMGLQPFELDHIVLEGYREQSRRVLQTLLRSLEATVKDYLLEHYEKHGKLPDDIIAEIHSWESSAKRHALTYHQLRVMDIKAECVTNDIPRTVVAECIQSVARWDEEQKQLKLGVLKSALQEENRRVNKGTELVSEVSRWLTRYASGERLEPDQAKIVILINEMQMYGVPQNRIDAVIDSVSSSEGDFRSMLKKWFHRRSGGEESYN